MFYWIMKNLVAGPLLKTIFRPWVVGTGPDERIERGKGTRKDVRIDPQ